MHNCSDFIPYDSDLPIRSYFRYIVDSAIPRTSKDTTVNTQGRYLLDLCISSRIRIVNGRLDGDSYGDYTCYTPRGCSVVDYALVSADVLQEVLYFKVEDLPIYSDHCPIVLSVKHGYTDCREEEDQQYSAAKYHSLVESVRWNEEIQANFRESIEENTTIQMIAEIQSEVDQDNVNASAKKVETLLKTIIKRAGGASTYKQTTRKSTKFPKKRWFDTDCKKQKHISLLTHFRVLQECATPDNGETRENCMRYVPLLDEEITEEEVLISLVPRLLLPPSAQ